MTHCIFVYKLIYGIQASFLQDVRRIYNHPRWLHLCLDILGSLYSTRQNFGHVPGHGRHGYRLNTRVRIPWAITIFRWHSLKENSEWFGHQVFVKTSPCVFQYMIHAGRFSFLCGDDTPNYMDGIFECIFLNDISRDLIRVSCHVFSLPISFMMIVRIDVLIDRSYYHHNMGSMTHLPLFRVRPWNNDMRCMSCTSFFILTTVYSYSW